MIQFQNVSKHFDQGAPIVKSLHLTIHKGEFFVLIGPSGSGKTTTLKMINRLIDLSEGTILIHGKKISDYDIHELRWNIGYVLQQIALFPHMTIAENIAIVPEMKKWTKEKMVERVDELLTMVGLEPHIYRNRKPRELSGGQQQRVGVIRALAADPDIIIMDEPFSALDPISREKLQDDILTLQRSIKKTIVFVTHDMQEALKLGDRIAIMKDGELVQVGTPDELVHRPANDFVSSFIGRTDTKLPVADFDLTRLISDSTSFTGNYEGMETLSVNSSLERTLELLSQQEQVPVVRDGVMVGMLDRQTMLQHLSGQVKMKVGNVK
ncbi:ABC transporter ATP-binding protein [Paenibacillus arenosi]|uniref:Quaternary amine transport ATP-binding protein n=1 Tax=Paenibacillus arenosi TaxID=2774142 RepID=A0ABR9B0Y9_9BACL|nr:ABC transporter ATP-binding protein [Paenibacillus arenosi]MBD8499564.1 ABC transporter ATP-binding protein [Paenibacillus arenosi]